jgi:hypothetical protein
MSTHCQLFSPGVLYGTRGTPMGIMVVTLRVGAALAALTPLCQPRRRPERISRRSIRVRLPQSHSQ